MLFPKDEIISDIDARIKRTGGECSDWYVGVAKDSREPRVAHTSRLCDVCDPGFSENGHG
jgi:hypothetical protein